MGVFGLSSEEYIVSPSHILVVNLQPFWFLIKFLSRLHPAGDYTHTLSTIKPLDYSQQVSSIKFSLDLKYDSEFQVQITNMSILPIRT